MHTPLRVIRAQFESNRDAAITALDEFLEKHPDDVDARLLKVEFCLKAKANYSYISPTLREIAAAHPDRSLQVETLRAQVQERAWEILQATRARLRQRSFGQPAGDPIAEMDAVPLLCPDQPDLILAAALALLRANHGTTPFDNAVTPLPKPSPPAQLSNALDGLMGRLDDDALDDDDDDDDEEVKKPTPPPPPPRPSPFGGSPFSGPSGPTPAQYAAAQRYLQLVIGLTQPGNQIYEVAVICLTNRAIAIGEITPDILRRVASLGEPRPQWQAIYTRLIDAVHQVIWDTALGYMRRDDADGMRRIADRVSAAGVKDEALDLLLLEPLISATHEARREALVAFFLRHEQADLPTLIETGRALPPPPRPDVARYPIALLLDLLDLITAHTYSCRVCNRAIRLNLTTCPHCETNQPTRELNLEQVTLAPYNAFTGRVGAYISLAQLYVERGEARFAEIAWNRATDLVGMFNPAFEAERIKTIRDRIGLAALAKRQQRIDKLTGRQGDSAGPVPSQQSANAIPAPNTTSEAHMASHAMDAAMTVLRASDSGMTPDLVARIIRLNDDPKAWRTLRLNQRAALVRRLIAVGQLRVARETAAAAFADAQDSQTARTTALALTQAVDARVETVLRDSEALIADDKPEAAIGLTTDALALRDDPRLRLMRAEARIAIGHDLPALGDLYSIDDRDAALHERALTRAVGILESRWDIDGTRILLAHVRDRAFVARVEERLRRREQGEPAIVTAPADWQVNDDLLTGEASAAPLIHAWFAVSLREVGIGGDEQFYRRLSSAQIEFIQVLGAQRDMMSRAVFALRLISEPHPHVPARGRIRVALLARVSAHDTESAIGLARALWNDFNAMLPMAQENVYVYEPVVDDAEVRHLLMPFDPVQTAEIARRESIAGGVYSVSNFMTGTPDLHNVHWTLLRQSAPSMISLQIMPTSLYAWERPTQDAAEWMTASGDNPLEMVAPGGASLTFMKRQLAQQQQWQKLNVADQRLTYLQNGFILRLYIAGADGTSQLLPEMAAATLLAPLQDNGFSGGFQVIRPTKADEVAVLRRNLALLDVERWDGVPDDWRVARLRNLVSEGETAALFRLPVPHNGGVPGMAILEGKALVPPSGMPTSGARLGVSVARVRGVPVPITQGLDDRRRHTYVVGKTGMGKSTLLQTLILQDMEAGRGVFLLDPHGDLCEDVLARIPPHRRDDVILFDPSDDQYPIGLNILRAETEDDRDRVVSDFIGLLIRMYDPHNYAIVGPIFQQTVRNAMLAAMCLPDGTLVDVYRMISDQDGSFVKKVVPHITDPIVKNYWEDVAKRMRDASSQWKAEFLPYVLSKFSRFIEDATLRRMIGQKRSGVPFDAVMDEGKILLVNLAKGKIGEQNALFMGSLILSGIMSAAFKRGALPPSRRRDFMMYIDEVQNFATPTLATMLSEGRKFGVVLTIANQYLHQLNGQILEAVFGNIGSIIAFRLGIQDVGALGMEFHPAYAPQELSGLPQFTAAVKLLIDGVAARPFTMRTLPSMVPPDRAGAEAVRSTSQTRYGTPIAEVEAEIGKRFTP